MTELAIDARHLAKRFRIAGRQERYVTLRDTLSKAARTPIQTLRRRFQPADESIWALKDVSFEVPHGEVMGIVGRNGSGKSTLLKVLSRITEPTRGCVDVVGRVGSLLEVGSGFHMELTGRENIYLNGAILGMKRAAINRLFDDIVGFAEVEQFVDTPVKRYSSGMFMRLAFAVAAHLETEILLIDEILAVGDVKFQKRCIERLGEVAGCGRTVLFVSHNMSAVRSLCTTGIVLDYGEIITRGDVVECIEAYHQSIGALPRGAEDESQDGTFGRIYINGELGRSIDHGDTFEVSTDLRVEAGAQAFCVRCRIEDMQGHLICMLRATNDELGYRIGEEEQRTRVALRFPPLWLKPGIYSLHFEVGFAGAYGSNDVSQSERFPLDVMGNHTGIGRRNNLDPVLCPRVEWSVEGSPSGTAGVAEDSLL